MEAPGATISRMAFNADGQKLFFWLEGHAADYVRIFEIDPLNKSAHGPPSLRFGKVSKTNSRRAHR